jgi:hypothetical protein
MNQKFFLFKILIWLIFIVGTIGEAFSLFFLLIARSNDMAAAGFCFIACSVLLVGSLLALVVLETKIMN